MKTLKWYSKITDFKEFAFSINTKYKDLDTTKLNEQFWISN